MKNIEMQDESQRDVMRKAKNRIDRVSRCLHLGGALTAAEYERFLAAWITHVVDLRENDEADTVRLSQLGIERRHIPVPDHCAPTIEQLAEVAGWLEAGREGAEVYVHCGGGFGRAPTMAIALLLVGGSTLANAMEQARAVRPEIRLNEEQLGWLRLVEAQATETSSAIAHRR